MDDYKEAVSSGHSRVNTQFGVVVTVCKTQSETKSQHGQGNCAYNPSPKQVASAN